MHGCMDRWMDGWVVIAAVALVVVVAPWVDVQVSCASCMQPVLQHISDKTSALEQRRSPRVKVRVRVSVTVRVRIRVKV